MFGGNEKPRAKTQAKRGKIAEVAPATGKKAVEVKKATPKSKPKSVAEALANIEAVEKPEVPKAKKPVNLSMYTNRVFHTGTEQLMSWVFSTEPGDMPMPIPNISKKDRENLVSILISKNEVKEGDSEKVAFCKKQVDAAKKEMAKYIADGGDPDEFLQYYYQELRTCFETRREAIRQARNLFKDDPELGKEFVGKVNEKFEKDGIKPLKKEQFE